MNILMILSNPLMVDPRVHKEAKALVDAGNKVTVIVWDRKGEYDDEGIVDGIKIIRIYNKGLLKILPKPLLKIPVWWRKAYKKGLALYKNGFDFDVVHCHDFDTLKVGLWLKKRLGCKLIYDAHEIFGYMLKDEHPILSKIVFSIEKKLVRNVDHIITIDEPFRKHYCSFNKPVTTVMNCKDLMYLDYEPPNNDVFTLIYIGIMGRSRFFPQIIEIVGGIDGVKLILAGKKELLFDDMRELSKKYENIEFLGTVPTKDILHLTRNADVTFVLADVKGQHHLNVFNKQFEAMVCGRPIIVTKGTYAAELTNELNCGISVDYNEDSVKKAIIQLRDNPRLCQELGMNALKAAKEIYNWDVEKKNLLKVYKEII